MRKFAVELTLKYALCIQILKNYNQSYYFKMYTNIINLFPIYAELGFSINNLFVMG